MPYLAPRYVEVPKHIFNQYRDITTRYSGSAEPASVSLSDAPTIMNGASFVAGSAGAKPEANDIVLISQTDRIDGFTADGRFFVLYES